MTSFASRDNIDLIWDVIVTFPLFHELYPSEESKLRWFNSIICRFQNTFIENINDLHIVNRGVITTMMNDLQKSPRHSNVPLEKENTKSNATLEAFSHKIDEPIQNMSELVQKHMDERVMSFENIFPPNTLPRDHFQKGILSQNNFENGILPRDNFQNGILPQNNFEHSITRQNNFEKIFYRETIMKRSFRITLSTTHLKVYPHLSTLEREKHYLPTRN